MNKAISQLLTAALCFFAFQVQAEVENYIFNSYTNSAEYDFPGLLLTGEVTGKLNLKKNTPYDNPPSQSEFNILRVAFNFNHAPDLVATNFKYNPQNNSYLASVAGAWVFKSVDVEISNIRAEEQTFDFKITVDTNKHLTNSHEDHNQGQINPVLLTGNGYLINKTPFKLIDAANTTVNGKRLSIKLNANISANMNPEKGMLGQGIELKVLWFGRGEKLFYIPAPSQNIKPVGIIINTFDTGVEKIQDFFIRYEENGNIHELPPQPLQLLLDQAFQQR